MGKQSLVVLKMNSYEHGIVIRALNNLRNDLLNKQCDPGPVEDLLLRAIDAPSKKGNQRNENR